MSSHRFSDDRPRLPGFIAFVLVGLAVVLTLTTLAALEPVEPPRATIDEACGEASHD